MTIAEVRENIRYLNPAFDDTLTVRGSLNMPSCEARHKAGMANFEENRKDNGGYVAKKRISLHAAKSTKVGACPPERRLEKLERTLGLPRTAADLDKRGAAKDSLPCSA